MLTPETQSMLPIWMQKFSFWTSIVLVLYKAIELYVKLARKPSLRIVVTREVFFRILDPGECLYANAVLVASDSGALITDLAAKLKKDGEASKNYSMRVAQVGEKFRDNDGDVKFSFTSTSPLAFVSESVPLRQVYICHHDTYANKAQSILFQFDKEILDRKRSLGDMSVQDSAYVADQLKEMKDLSDATAVKLMETIQIEPGEYTLSIEVKYNQKWKYIPKQSTKTASSSVQFKVEEWAREYLKSKLQESLFLRVTHQLGIASLDGYSAPQYNPVNVKEVVE